MTEPIRVLHVLGGLSIGGAESRIMDLYRNMDREKIQFDFLIHTTENSILKKKSQNLEGRFTGSLVLRYTTGSAMKKR